MKFRLVIAYDGTNYEGWQVQKTGLGVQQCMETSERPASGAVQPGDRIEGADRERRLARVGHVEHDAERQATGEERRVANAGR